MSDPKARVLCIFPLETREEDAGDATLAGAHMPIGSLPFTVVPHGEGGIGLAVMCPMEMGPRVWHSMIIAPADQPVTPRLGRMLGSPLGMIPLAGRPTALLPELPWPTHAQVN